TGASGSYGSTTANYIVAAPDGSSGVPSTRAMVTNDLPTVPVTKGGTGLTTTILGALPYGSGANTYANLAPNTTTTKQFLSMKGTGSVGASPAWSSLAASDLQSGQVPLAQGGNANDLSAAGGLGCILTQSSAGGVITSRPLASQEMPTNL
ncbi:unnamed protein product, partial [Phaeothamnion confervicola]